MLRYIFKNYDHFLEYIRASFEKLIHKKSNTQKSNLQLIPQDVLELEIKTQEENLSQKDDIKSKEAISRIIAYLRLKKKALITTNKYIKRAQDILRDGIDDSAYEALDYLKRVPNNLSTKDMNEIYIYKAYIYELLKEFDDASTSFKEAIKYDKTPNTLALYKQFVQRSREVLSWGKHSKKYEMMHLTASIHKITKIEDMPEVIERLDNISKYYARSPKSRSLGKKYFREILKMYKILVEQNPKKYTCGYIEALLDGVEIFMMPTTLLNEIQELLKNPQDCIEARVYLIERLNELKQKGFVKNSKLFKQIK